MAKLTIKSQFHVHRMQVIVNAVHSGHPEANALVTHIRCVAQRALESRRGAKRSENPEAHMVDKVQLHNPQLTMHLRIPVLSIVHKQVLALNFRRVIPRVEQKPAKNKHLKHKKLHRYNYYEADAHMHASTCTHACTHQPSILTR